MTLVAILLLVSMTFQPSSEPNRIELFALEFMHHYWTDPVPGFHREIYHNLDDHSIFRMSIEAARGSGKSTIASVIYPLYEICEGDYDEIQLFSQSGGQAGLSTKWLRKIKAEIIDNTELRNFYGLQPGAGWAQDYIEVIRGDGKKIELFSRGKHSAARGNRGLVFIDDPQDAKDCRSEAVLLADEEWLFSDILPIMLEGQRLLFIGTSISPLSLLSKVQQLPNWKTLKFPAEEPPGSGHSVWPEHWSDEFLQLQREDMGIERYWAEYLCKPRVSGNPVFKPEWFSGYDPKSAQFRKFVDGGALFTVTGMDTAESKSTKADYTAICTFGATMEKRPRIFCLDVKRQRWSTKEGAEQLLITFDQFKQHKSVVESRCGPDQEDAMIEEIKDRERIYSKYVNMYPVRPNRDKVTRAMGVQSLFQEGRVHFNLHDKDQQHLISELTMFTGQGEFHDDCVDATVHALREIKDWAKHFTAGAKATSAYEGNW